MLEVEVVANDGWPLGNCHLYADGSAQIAIVVTACCGTVLDVSGSMAPECPKIESGKHVRVEGARASNELLILFRILNHMLSTAV